MSIVVPQNGCQVQTTMRAEDISNQQLHPETFTS